MAKLNIVLHEPEIPANTGNIGRTCVATGTRLHLIEPLGFSLSEKALKRAGMDYWEQLDLHRYMNFDEFAENVFGQKVIAETNGKTLATHEHEMDWKISKLSCDLTYCKDEDIAACYEELSSIYYYIKHNTEIVEMVPHGFSKGTGIEKVCELLDVPIQNTYAFGDSPNDMEMLKVAGNAVVMGNGFDEVKAIGDYVTDDLYHDGIYNACKYYNLI